MVEVRHSGRGRSRQPGEAPALMSQEKREPGSCLYQSLPVFRPQPRDGAKAGMVQDAPSGTGVLDRGNERAAGAFFHDGTQGIHRWVDADDGDLVAALKRPRSAHVLLPIRASASSLSSPPIVASRRR